MSSSSWWLLILTGLLGISNVFANSEKGKNDVLYKDLNIWGLITLVVTFLLFFGSILSKRQDERSARESEAKFARENDSLYHELENAGLVLTVRIDCLRGKFMTMASM
jgi:hypothetical protein